MRRLALALAVVGLAAASLGVTAASPAGAAAPQTTVYLINSYSYKGGSIFDGAFCIGGQSTAVSTEQTSQALVLPSGSTTVDFFSSSAPECGVDTPTASATLDLPEGGPVFIMAYWPADGPAIALLPSTNDCVAEGFGRLTVRNGADAGGNGAVDIYGTPPGGSNSLLIAGIPAGGQGSAELPLGTYTDVYATRAGTQTFLTDIVATFESQSNGVQYENLYGGNDGSVGSFTTFGQELNTCAVVTTTTTTAPVTTTTAPPAAAKAVQATPAFTG